jgi:hypothetical protein
MIENQSQRVGLRWMEVEELMGQNIASWNQALLCLLWLKRVNTIRHDAA